MGKPKRKHVLNAALKALIAGAETSTGIKIATTFISELAALPEDKQKELGGLSQEQFNQWVTESDVATAEVTEETRDIVKEISKKVDTLLEKHRAELKEEGRKVLTAKLPVTGRELFGRDRELAILDDAWGAGHTYIISLVAWGGVGKSALVNEWLSRIEADNWRGAERVYGWSFYSQGTREDAQASGDTFLEHALKWFGDKEPAEGSPWDKGVRLAGLIRENRTLLILDGLEPLQYPPGEMQGRLKDQGLGGLIREISRSNNGLCVITTRENVADIENTVGRTTKRVLLENLSEEAGAEVLKNLGVKGPKKELRDTSREFKGHALALNLLGSYLATVHDGEIWKRDLVPGLTEDEEKGGHAKRVMESYEIWLKKKPELDILYVMGLFDRPADEGAINVLREEPAIKGLTEQIVKLSDAKWRYAVKHLRGLRLLAVEDKQRGGETGSRIPPSHKATADSPFDELRSTTLTASRRCKSGMTKGSGEAERLDCHPLIREHFGAKLREGNAAAWRQAHSRLYEYYKGVPGKEQPDTLDEMEPLFCAVAHGCQAGRQQETLIDVYWKRIRRGKEAYSVHKLGAFGSDLAAVAGFFDKCWSEPAKGLADHDKAVVLNWAGFALRAVGRLREAAEPFEAALKRYEEIEDAKEIAIASGNLSELYLTLGEVNKAVDYGRQSVEYADRSGDEFQRHVNRTTLADALHQAGKITEAEKLFGEAEQMQRKEQPGYEYLYSFQGYRYCEVLLGQGRYEEVQKRAGIMLKEIPNWYSLLDIALDRLSLGRAYMLEAVKGGSPSTGSVRPYSRQAGSSLRYEKARGYLNAAVGGLRKANDQEMIVRGLLSRAVLCRQRGEYEKGFVELEEAREIVERGEMKLFLADCALECVRLCSAQGDKDRAREESALAKRLVGEMGYHRRDGEVEELEREIRL